MPKSDLAHARHAQNPKTVQIGLLTKAELMAMRPFERARYVEKILLQYVGDGKEWTIREIIEKTGLTRPTITKHLQRLVSNHQLSSEDRLFGAMRVTFYKKSGEINRQVQSDFKGNLNYTFFVLDSDEEQSICIQQRQKDDFGVETVKGAVAVDFDKFEKFLKELHTFGARVIKKS